MNKIRYWIIILLFPGILILINIIFSEKKSDQTVDSYSRSNPAYHSKRNDIMIYNHEGTLSYHLIAQDVKYFSEQKISWITNLVVTSYDKNTIPIWSIRSDRAKLTNNLMLYLYDHVEISTLTDNFQLRKIITNQAKIDLITQDITSQDQVTLYGITFYSNASRIHGNLYNKSIELIGKVRTSYDI